MRHRSTRDIARQPVGHAKRQAFRLPLHVLGFFLTLLLLSACDNEPVQKLYYIDLQKVQIDLCNGVKGDYEGHLVVIMCDSDKHQREDEEGVWERKALRDTIVNFPYMVGGYGNPFITIPDFPISWLSNTVSHPELKEALRTQPNISLTLAYQIKHEHLITDIKSKTGRITLFPSPVALYMTFGGSRHLVTLNFSNNSEYYPIQADDASTWNINHIRLSLQNVKIDGMTGENLDCAGSRALFEVFVDGEKKIKD